MNPLEFGILYTPQAKVKVGLVGKLSVVRRPLSVVCITQLE